jgi:HlyD family secretion protein
MNAAACAAPEPVTMPVSHLATPHPLLDAPTPRTYGALLLGLAIVLVFVVGFGVWSVLAPLAEAALTPGVIKVEGNRRTLQHLEGGIVREIRVRDGSKVQAGEVLVRLDSIQADATLATERAQRWALLAQDARLAAELAGASQVAFPADLLDSPEPRARDAVAGQQALFAARQASLTSQIEVLKTRIAQQQASVIGNRGRLAATHRQLELSRQEEEMRHALVREGLARLPDLYAVQRTVAGLEGSIEDIQGQIAQANGAIAEAATQIRQLIDQHRQEASTERREVRSKLAETEEKLRAAADIVTRREIVAPESGTVLNMRVFTLGAVLKPGDPVMDLVPDQDRLVAEVNVQPADIDVVHPGLHAEVRLPAFKQRLVPYLHGKVTWVAADVTINEQAHQQYYRAFILIDRDQLAHLPNVFLTPGMPVEAHVLTGERSFFRYLTQPIRDSFHRAFLEQ